MSKTTLLKLSSGSALLYHRIEYYRVDQPQKSLDNLVQNKPKTEGNISQGTLKKIRNISDIFCTTLMINYRKEKGISKYRSPRRPVFLTCTLPEKQKHTDKEIRRTILNHFLISLKRCSNVKHYIQRSEAQKNGNIHFHFIVDAFVPKGTINKLWANACKLQGYKDKGNSCKIESPRHLETLSNYIAKYVSKAEPEDTKRNITGRVWSCAKPLHEIRHYEIMVAYEENFEGAENPAGVDLLESIKGDAAYEYICEYCEYYRPHKDLQSYMTKDVQEEYKQHYSEIYSKLYT